MASLGACPAPLALSLLLLPLLLLWPPPLASAKLPLPAYIKPCNASAPMDELEACATRHAQEGFPSVVKGDRRYKVPALNPLFIPRMVVDDGQGPLGLNLVATDVHFGGMQNVRIDRVRFDMEKKYAWYDVLVPVASIESKYNISGRILLLPITGYGDCNLTMKDMFISYEYRFNLERRPDGEVYFIPLPHDGFRFNTSRLYVHLDNLFNGDPLLGDNTNKFMNDNWEEMLVSLGPIFSTAISEIVHSILTNIFQLVPFTDAFTGTDKYLPP
ncbi:hypothetical protein R5R35_009476 [Gryllus longicercus]|uniref:Protein takeout-like n=1 Tax=Gryllus longicercus TaxID=2509291 RepID=A0AAN9VTM7_9ORTH